jgi:hypothetical protein
LPGPPLLGGQQYNQAIDEFALSVLRKESGAAISPSEHEQFARTYFSSRATARRRSPTKQAARQRVLDGLKFEASSGPCRSSDQSMNPLRR